MEAIKRDDSIECNAAEVISRDIKLSSFVNLPNIGKCRKYNCKRNSEGTIVKELKNKEKDRNYPTSMVGSGDTIRGENITVYVRSMKQLKIEVINYTGTHKAQKTQTNDYTYALISQQFHNIRTIHDSEQRKLGS